MRKARGITSESGILNEMGVLFGNRTASSLFSLMFLQQEKIEKNMKISQNAMGVGASLVKLATFHPRKGAEDGARQVVGESEDRGRRGS